MRSTRRQFVQGAGAIGLALMAGCGRLPFQVQAPGKIPRVGVLTANLDPSSPWLSAFRQRLAEAGYVEVETIVFEHRSAEGHLERLPDLAAALIQLHPDVIVAVGTPPTLALKQRTSQTPIVFTSVGDPVGAGLVASLARPVGNVTGLTNLNRELGAKRLELLTATVPGARRVAVLVDSANPSSALDWEATQVAARVLAVQLQTLAVQSTGEIENAFAAALGEHADVLVVLPSNLFDPATSPVLDLATRHRLPAMFGEAEFVRAGGLMAYGPVWIELYRRAAYYIDRILKGTKPSDLPVEQPTTFDLVINLRTAQALGLAIPEHVLLQATEVIQ